MRVEISYGEAFDKLSILHVKRENITDEKKLTNVFKEISYLEIAFFELGIFPYDDELFDKLLAVNKKLWEIEDAIRIKERNQDFGSRFIELAQAVYFNNDKRFRIKQAINNVYGSELVEEKQLPGYNPRGNNNE